MLTEREIERIVETYSNALLRIALHHVNNYAQAQDIVQDVFLKLVNKSPDFVDAEHEKAWLFRVAINQCMDFKRSWWNKKRSEYANEDYTGKEDVRYEVLDEVKKLPFHYRNAIYLFYYEELSTKQIADICKVKENTVSSWLFRGKKQLKKQLKGGWTHE